VVFLPCPLQALTAYQGHTIIAASVAPGTLLYHGTTFPPFTFDRPDWLATDPEHAFVFCRHVCQILTFVATRTLRLAYFDGSSAAKMPSGTMDSQDILIWGEVKPDKWFEEFSRITDACEWGKKYGLDGFVRFVFFLNKMLKVPTLIFLTQGWKWTCK
jgi:hypothetical protein